MPDPRLRRTRKRLPEGYQFGDMRPRLAFHPRAFAMVWPKWPISPLPEGFEVRFGWEGPPMNSTAVRQP